MSLILWKPRTELDSLHRQMDRLFDQMMGGFLAPPTHGLPALEATRPLSPSFELYTTGDELVVTAELPGIEPADVDVEVTPEAVRVAGELRKPDEVADDGYFRSERRYGRFERVVPLPCRVRDGEARASFRHGVLTVRLPLADVARPGRPRKLAVEVG